jgi:hypothetical protein
VAHTCNLSYSGGTDQEDRGSKSASGGGGSGETMKEGKYGVNTVYTCM